MARIETNAPPGASAPHPRRPHGPFVTINDCECIRSSDKAALVFVSVDFEPIWFPLSQIADSSEVYKADTKGKLVITKWIFDQKVKDYPGLAQLGQAASAPPPPPSAPNGLAEPYRLYRQFARKYHPDINPVPYANEVMADFTTLWRAVLKELKK